MQSSREPKEAGLMRDDTGRFSVPLYGVKLETYVVNFCATVILQQRFYNNEQSPVSATYVLVCLNLL